MNRGVEWSLLVVRAREGSDGLEALLVELEPIFITIARQIASQIVEDAVEAARVAVWEALPRVDLERPTSVRAMLTTCGVRAMRDEVRRYLRQSRNAALPGDDLEAMTPPVHDKRDESAFVGVLLLYLDFVEQTGGFEGAHKHVAEVLGLGISRATALFHKASKQFADGSGLRHEHTTHGDIIARLLQGAGNGGGRGGAARH